MQGYPSYEVWGKLLLNDLSINHLVSGECQKGDHFTIEVKSSSEEKDN